jgi:hypothetical protein
MAELGISDFETVRQTRRRQEDLVRCLKRARVDPEPYAGFAGCGLKTCGRSECDTEGCFFAMRRRRLREIKRAYRLLRKADPPLHEVRVIRNCWHLPFGQLSQASILAVKQLNRRALDSLYQPGTIAVGVCKLFAGPDYDQRVKQKWICELHMIVAGPTKEELEQAFTTVRHTKNSGGVVIVTEITNLGQAINNVLRRDLQEWHHPAFDGPFGTRPKRARRTEYYVWQLGLGPTERVVRYGCDRHLNRLKKQPRKFRWKLPKKRPYPWWLERHMFGRGRWENKDPQDQPYKPKPNKQNVVDPPPDYYDI